MDGGAPGLARAAAGTAVIVSKLVAGMLNHARHQHFCHGCQRG